MQQTSNEANTVVFLEAMIYGFWAIGMNIYDCEPLQSILFIRSSHSLKKSLFSLLQKIVMVFFSCEIGQRFSDAYKEIDDKIDEFNWYLMLMKIQRILPIIMINTQQPIFIECFGSSTCSRETFKKVNEQL